MIPSDWLFGLAGGMMIGLAAALFLLMNGRIMGASGILGGLVDGSGRENAGERVAFVAGLVGVPALLGAFTIMPPTNATTNIGLLIGAGLLVGVGTRLGSGCTSGHGVCGMSRLSIRSIVATLIYIGAGVVTVTALRGMGGL